MADSDSGSECDSGSDSGVTALTFYKVGDNDRGYTTYSCDSCEKPMLKEDACWVFKDNAPLYYSASGFCVCDACHPGSLTHCEADVSKDSEADFAEEAQNIFRCGSHNKPNLVVTSLCNCRCAVCDKPGHWGCEREWYLGQVRLYTGFGVFITFLLCPSCVPSSVHDMGSTVGGEFSRKWFDPHLTKTTLGEHYNLTDVPRSDDDL